LGIDQFHENSENANNILEVHNYIHWYNKGVDACYSKNYPFAADALNKAIQLNPNDIWSFYWRAFVYGKLGNYQEAIEDYHVLIDYFPQNARFYLRRGNAYDNLGEHQRAIEDYNEAIRLNPNYTDAYYNRALACADLKQYQLSIEGFSKVISLKPAYADAYFYRGNVYFLQGMNDLGYSDALNACKLGNKKLLEWAIKYGIRPAIKS
jgi:tetratricopeptide (TPR) repeat protein